MQHNSLPQPSFHHQQSTGCKMRMTNVFIARNQDTSHDTALTLDIMNVKNTDI